MKTILLILVISSQLSAAWTKCYAIVFNNHPASTLTDFPALFCANGPTGGFCDSVAHTNLVLASLKTTGNGGDVTSSSGFDVGWFSDSSCTTTVPFELTPTVYSPTTGLIEMWVKVSSLASGSDTTLYLGVGNAAITTDQSSTSTWPSGYKAVWHHPNGSSLTLADSTSNGFNGTNVGTVTAAAGQIDGGSAYNGSTQYVTTTATQAGTADYATWSCWMKPTDSSAMILLSDTVANNRYLFKNSDDTVRFQPSSLGTQTITSTTLSSGAWSYVVATVLSGVMHSIYINGVEASYSDHGGSGQAGVVTFWQIGAYNDLSLKMKGSLDECRIDSSNSAASGHSADWILAEYHNQNQPWNFYTIGNSSSSAPIRHRVIQ